MSSEPVRHPLLSRRPARALLSALVVLALLTSACDDSPTLPTGGGQLSLSFSSNIQPSGVVSRSFIASQSGTVEIYFLSLSIVDIEMAIGLGTTDSEGRGCTITSRVTAKPDAVNPVISSTVTAGNYCLQIADVGNLQGLASFTISFTRP